jgi:pimeloyl-ACP methyl ester carboxylesterase
VFAHEFCSDMWSCARYCRPLQTAGYDIFTFDFRGHGESGCEPGYTPRQWLSDRELHDMRGALAFVRGWLRERGLPEQVGVFGISRGGCAAILAAEEHADVAAIATDGVFSTDTIIEYYMRRWAYIFATVRVVYENHPPAFWRFLRWGMMYFARREFGCRFPSVRKALLRMTPRPTLFIHGAKDSHLPVEHSSRRLYAIAGQPKYLWVAPEARHSQAVMLYSDLYAELIVRFFNAHLAPHSGAAPEVDATGIAGVAARVAAPAGDTGARLPAARELIQPHRGPPAEGPEERVFRAVT